MHWGMVIDLRTCIGCGCCALVCSQANGLPSNLWRRVIDCGISPAPSRTRLCLPLSCMQCSEPPCEEACPTGATHRGDDGIVDIRHDRCIGCGYCVVSCPYLARSIIFGREDGISRGNGKGDAALPGHLMHNGTCSKCNFCQERVDGGLAKGLLPGEDPEATPLCVVSCSSGALTFGDLDDPGSRISALIGEHQAIVLQEDMGTKPSVYYIIDNPVLSINRKNA